MLHQIDFRDHRDFARPLEFLRYSDPLWRFISAGSYTNRWRRSQFLSALERQGFGIVFETPTGDEINGDRVPSQYLDRIRPHLHSRFASLAREDLETLGCLVLCSR